MAKQKTTGAGAVVRALQAEGVEVIFGIPGGAILPLYDALHGVKSPRHILVRHEQVGGHAAEGYALATGKVGVCLGTSGPGATNLVTPIADAYMDSVPLVAITANVSSALLGSDAFQEADITGITVPVTKHNWLVTDVQELPEVLKEAFYVARTGRPGPVLVDIPKDVLNAALEFEYPETVDIPGYHPPVREEPRLKDAAQLIRSSTRPVVYLGGGVRTAAAHREVFAFAELLDAPVVTTVHGKGALPGDAPAVPGHVRHARRPVRQLRGAGLGPDRRPGGPLRRPRHRQALHLRPRGEDRPPGRRPGRDLQAGHGHRAAGGRPQGAPPQAHRGGAPRLRGLTRGRTSRRGRRRWPTGARSTPCATRRSGRRAPRRSTSSRPLWKKTQGKAVVTTGVGEHQMFAAQWWKTTEPRQFITSGGLGTMGFCLPAAIGIQLARPEALVIGIDGDGSPSR